MKELELLYKLRNGLYKLYHAYWLIEHPITFRLAQVFGNETTVAKDEELAELIQRHTGISPNCSAMALLEAVTQTIQILEES